MHILNAETLEKSESFNYLSLYDQDFRASLKKTKRDKHENQEQLIT